MTNSSRFQVALLMGTMPLTLMAQDDDMYFVPSKEQVERSEAGYGLPRSTYYVGSTRDVDEYNRRSMGPSHYQVVSPDTTGNDVISFSGEVGVYPDSLQTDDYALTRQMARYDGYEPDLAYRDGYRDGLNDSWHSPWYFYSSYYPWYDSYWYWRDPWYYDYYGWYHPYGWHIGYYHYGWHRPYYYGGGYWHGGGGRGRVYARNGNTGTIDRSGRSHGYFSSSSSTRRSTAASRAATGNSRSTSGNFNRSSSYSSYNRTTPATSSSSNFNRSSSMGSSSGSFSRSSSGGFSGGGGSRGGGGGFGRVSR